MSLPSKYILPIFFLTVFGGAMLLGPFLYWGLEGIYPIPFHRAMDRALLISAVAALGLIGPRLALAKLWPWNGEAGKQLLLGYGMAAVTVQAMIGFDAAFVGFTGSALTTQPVLSRVLLALMAALLIPPLEETVFRGFLQRELAVHLGWRGGWIMGAMIFMLAHFIKIPINLDQQPVHFWSGITAMGAAFGPVVHGEFLGGRGLNLFLLGLILGGIFLRSGTLWVNASLHSGLVLAWLLFSGLTRPTPDPRIAFLSGDLLSNPITSVVFVMLGLWLWRFYRNPTVLPESGGNAR